MTPHPTQTRDRIIVSRCFEKQRESLYKPVRIQKKEKGKNFPSFCPPTRYEGVPRSENKCVSCLIGYASRITTSRDVTQYTPLPTTKEKKSHDKRHSRVPG
jgi:spore coat protein CotF